MKNSRLIKVRIFHLAILAFILVSIIPQFSTNSDATPFGPLHQATTVTHEYSLAMKSGTTSDNTDSWMIRERAGNYLHTHYGTDNWWMAAWDFNNLNGYSDPEPTWPDQILVPENNTNYHVWYIHAILIAKPNSPTQSGHFSVCYNYPYILGMYNWQNPKSVGTWTDSATFPDFDGTYTEEEPDTYYNGYIGRYNNFYYFNWSSLTSLTPTQVRNASSIRIMWETNDDSTTDYYDYLGITYWFIGDIIIPPEIVYFEENFNGLIWLLILFLPAIIMQTVIPKIGFAAGITIMLIVLGLTQAGFLPIMLLGIIAVAVMLYKGEG